MGLKGSYIVRSIDFWENFNFCCTPLYSVELLNHATGISSTAMNMHNNCHKHMPTNILTPNSVVDPYSIEMEGWAIISFLTNVFQKERTFK